MIQAANNGILKTLCPLLRNTDIFTSLTELEEHLWMFAPNVKKAKEILFSFNLEGLKDMIIDKRVFLLKERIVESRQRIADIQTAIDTDLMEINKITKGALHRIVTDTDVYIFLEWLKKVNKELKTIKVEI